MNNAKEINTKAISPEAHDKVFNTKKGIWEDAISNTKHERTDDKHVEEDKTSIS